MSYTNSGDLDTRRQQRQREKPSALRIFPRATRAFLALVIGIGLVGSAVFAVATGLAATRNPNPLYFTDYEGAVEWQIFSEREYPNLKLWMSDVAYGRAVEARYFDCLVDESSHFQTLRISRGHQGLVVDSRCDPLDFSDVTADKIHPDLVVTTLFTRRDYIATLPGYSPTGNRAILLRTQWDDFVLINYDILLHLGLIDGAVGQ